MSGTTPICVLMVHGPSPKGRTVLELAAVFKMLLELRDEFAHEKIRWYTDNTNVPRILMYGSMKSDLHSLALSIFSVCLKHNIVLLPEWIGLAISIPLPIALVEFRILMIGLLIKFLLQLLIICGGLIHMTNSRLRLLSKYASSIRVFGAEILLV